MSALDSAKAATLLFVAAILQVSIFSGVTVVHARPQVLLVAVVCISLLRGAVVGAAAGFCAGLVADTGVFGMLGFTSLLLTLAGYWAGRYGETTGRDRTHAPLLAVAVTSALYQVGALMLHFMLGQPAPARVVLLDGLAPTVLLNVLLTLPVYALVRRLLRQPQLSERPREVQLLG